MPNYNPVEVEIWRHLLASVSEEMGATLERAAFSPNIKERRDHSCAIFNAQGEMLAQAAHIPVHLGAMPLMMESLLNLQPSLEWRPDEMWICNDPRVGGTHLPDLTLIAPVFLYEDTENEANFPQNELIGFVANRAHHADIGGIAPGSLPLSTSLYQEGLILPPLRLVRDDKLQQEIVALICANSRTPEERRGDLSAQVGANAVGKERFRELFRQSGRELFTQRTTETLLYAEAVLNTILLRISNGTYTALDVLDGDGTGAIDIPIRVALTVEEGKLTFDFTGSALQTEGSANATEAITRSVCYYLVRCLAPPDLPTNSGCFRAITVIAPAGTIVNADYPAAVATGNVETSQRILDTILQALAKALPQEIPACSQGTMNNLLIGGYDLERQRPFAYYETIAGGAGASSEGDGASAIHTHMTNTLNTPIEVLETHYPLRVVQLEIADNTGGKGKFNGGNGLIRHLEILVDAHVSLITERRTHTPPGANGGEDGLPGHNEIILPDGTRHSLPPRWSEKVSAGTQILVRTPGGGGWGKPT